MKDIDILLLEFDKTCENREIYKSVFQRLITDLLSESKIQVHNISGRLKNRASLEKKIKSKQNKYKKLDEITDVIGIRIVTYYEDDVNEIAKIIEKEFEIDEENSIDKRNKEFDRFGYSSMHFVVKLSKNRKYLTEYRNYNNLKVEIQIRSILQHAWAEIEHDLGYKTTESIPNKVKRNFSRVAALLETADLEFTKLKTSIQKYEKSVDKLVEENPELTELNGASLTSFLRNNETIIRIENLISERTGIRLNTTEINELDNKLAQLKYFKIDSIKKLDETLLSYETQILDFVAFWHNSIAKEDEDPDYAENSFFSIGISIFNLTYIMSLERNNKEDTIQFMKDFKGYSKSSIKTINGIYGEVKNVYKNAITKKDK